MNQPERNAIQTSTQTIHKTHGAMYPHSTTTDTAASTIHYLQLNSHSQRPLFALRSDYRELLGLFEQFYHAPKDTKPVTTLAFCLLPRSIHWVIKTSESIAKPLGQRLQKAYTQFYNEQQQRNGSLFHPHMICQLVEPQGYLSDLVRQIHYLPVTEKLVADPSIYPWSSHGYYLNSQQLSLDWFDTAPLFNRVARQRAHPLRRYSQYMAQAPKAMTLIQANANLQDPIASLDNTHTGETALASEAYKTRITCLQQPTVGTHKLSVPNLIKEVCRAYGITRKDLQLRRRHRLTHEVKSAISALALDLDLASLSELAATLKTEVEQLENGIRFLQGQKPMFLHSLALSLSKPCEQSVSKAIHAPHHEDTNTMEPVSLTETEALQPQAAQS